MAASETGSHAGTSALVRNRGHAVDDLLLRLTYVPSKKPAEDIGKQYSNRIDGSSLRWQQVTSFSQWAPPSRSQSFRYGEKPSRAAISQKNWLLRTHPEASVLTGSIRDILADEIADIKKAGYEHVIRAHLLAVGEISDLGSGGKMVGRPCIAFASGEAGNMLTLICLDEDKMEWSAGDSIIRVRIASSDEGRWSGSGSPITLIRFFVDPKPQRTLRWLTVQTGLTTAVFEPELRISGYSDNLTDTERCAIDLHPICSIPRSRTGKGVPSDISFNPQSRDDSPQLAIVDGLGNWTLWNIVNHRRTRPMVWEPVLVAQSSVSDTTRPYSMPALISDHQVLWIARPAADLDHEPQYLTTLEEEPGRSPFGLMTRRTRSNLMLLSNTRWLRLHDSEHDTPLPALDLFIENKPNNILIIQPCPIEPSGVFVLTSTKIYWVTAKTTDNSICPGILLSCSHNCEGDEAKLNMSVSSTRSDDNHKICFVCIYALEDSHITIFRFAKHPDDGEMMQYHRGIVQLDAPPGFLNVALLPLCHETGNKAPCLDRTRFFQLLVLSPSLDVSCALVAWSDSRVFEFGHASLSEATRPKLSFTQRKRALKKMADVFVVSDTYDEKALLGRKEKAKPAGRSQITGHQTQKELKIRIANPLGEEEEHDCEGDSDGGTEPADKFPPILAVYEAIARQSRHSGLPLHTILSLSGHMWQLKSLRRLVRLMEAETSQAHPDGSDALVGRIEGNRASMDMYAAAWRYGNDSEPPSRIYPEIRDRDLARIAALDSLSRLTLTIRLAGNDEREAEEADETDWELPRFQSSKEALPAPDDSQDTEMPDAPTRRPCLDPSIAILQRYTYTDHVPPRKGGDLLVTFHWELGGDATKLMFKTREDEEADKVVGKRIKSQEIRRRKKEDKRKSDALVARSAQMAPMTSSRPLSSSQIFPVYPDYSLQQNAALHSQQLSGRGQASRKIGLSGAMLLQSSSQPLLATFDGFVSTPRQTKKKAKKGAQKTSGFR